MAEIVGPAFAKLNLMAGTARLLEQVELKPADLEVFNRDFDMLAEKLSKVDPELGHNFGLEKEFYAGVNQVAKGYFNMKPFGGLKSSTGQYGMNIIAPQNLRTDAAGQTPLYRSWARTVSVASGGTEAYILASGATLECYASAESEKKEVIGFHAFLSYKPDPKLILLHMEVNDYPYPTWDVEPYSKITKAEKLFKILPIPGRVILHPGGKFALKGFFDRGTTSLSGDVSIDVEICPFGLCFAEYDQFETSNID